MKNAVHESNEKARPLWTALRWKIAAAAGIFLLWILATIHIASASFDGGGIPVADANTQDGILRGTIRMMGDHAALYSGTSLESIGKSISVSFVRGGSLVLCPHSQMQILKAADNAELLLAFQAGGSAEPFPLRTGDEIITPDWRIDFDSDERKGDIGTLQVSTNRRGELCLDSNSQSGAYFRVTQMVGNASFQVVGQTTARFADGKMAIADRNPVNATSGCACSTAEEERSESLIASNAAASTGATSRNDLSTSPAALPAPAQSADTSSTETKKTSARRQHPQDVAGYVRSFVRLVFGR
jgi:hypothetical protein